MNYCYRCERDVQQEDYLSDRCLCLDCSIEYDDKLERGLCVKPGCNYGYNLGTNYCGCHKIANADERAYLEGKYRCIGYRISCLNLLTETEFNNCAGVCKDCSSARADVMRDHVIPMSKYNTLTDSEKEGYTRCNYKDGACSNFMDMGYFDMQKKHIRKCPMCLGRQALCESRMGRKRGPSNKPRSAEEMERRKERQHEKKYWIKSRETMKQYNPNFYTNKNAAAREWRRNNPDKMMQFYLRRSNDPYVKFDVYRRRARVAGIEFALGREQCYEFFKAPCAYCGTHDNNKSRYPSYTVMGKQIQSSINGVDRVDNQVGYTPENCISCCSLCNKFKYKTTKDTLLYKALAILNHLGAIKADCQHYYELNWSVGSGGEKYGKECYICGHKENLGIDRFKSGVDYTELSNNRACCSSCNYLKSDISYDILVEHLGHIANHNKGAKIDLDLVDFSKYSSCIKKVAPITSEQNIIIDFDPVFTDLICDEEEENEHEIKDSPVTGEKAQAVEEGSAHPKKKILIIKKRVQEGAK
jgi:hypothetical protein